MHPCLTDLLGTRENSQFLLGSVTTVQVGNCLPSLLLFSHGTCVILVALVISSMRRRTSSRSIHTSSGSSGHGRRIRCSTMR